MRVIGEYVETTPYCTQHVPEDSGGIPITNQDECDVPVNCDECEKLLHVRLTDDGYDYIAENIIVHVESEGEQGRSEILREWYEQYGHSVELDQEYVEALTELA